MLKKNYRLEESSRKTRVKMHKSGKQRVRKKARQENLPEEKEKRSLFNLLVVLLITIAVLVSLWASLKG